MLAHALILLPSVRQIGNATNASQFYRTVKRAIPVAEEFDAGHLA